VPEELARATSVTKRFGEILALKEASAAFRTGEIHAVCGENGAGKSTLLKVIAGMVVPDAGEVRVAGSTLAPHAPREAIARGVAMVLQHFALVPVLTALENLVLGSEPTLGGGVLDLASAFARAKKIGEELGVDLPLEAPVESLGVGERQRLEIARALFRDARLVILDEPTAVLTKTEAAALYRTLRRLADAGKGIVVVTHKMDEVEAHADFVTVMRKGAVLFSRAIDREGDVAAQVAEVTKAIMGGGTAADATRTLDSVLKPGDDVVLSVRDVRVGRALDGVSLDLHAGEIVGIAGVEGNGQKELVAILAGDVVADSGLVEGGPVAVVREDRQTEGLVLDASLRDNILLGELDRFAKGPLGILQRDAMNAEAKTRIERSGAPVDLDREARTLSGGNQQKIVVTRALSRTYAKAIVAAQPTRGVDLSASRDIHARLRESAERGAGVIVISADLDELRALSHRILVLARGKVVADLPPSTSDEELGKRMLGTSA
jgi:general nucleoside transport system ATP-binding protein